MACQVSMYGVLGCLATPFTHLHVIDVQVFLYDRLGFLLQFLFRQRGLSGCCRCWLLFNCKKRARIRHYLGQAEPQVQPDPGISLLPSSLVSRLRSRSSVMLAALRTASGPPCFSRSRLLSSVSLLKLLLVRADLFLSTLSPRSGRSRRSLPFSKRGSRSPLSPAFSDLSRLELLLRERKTHAA